jgi:hypothetical protein
MAYGDEKLIQFRVGFWHEIDEPCIQMAGPISKLSKKQKRSYGKMNASFVVLPT